MGGIDGLEGPIIIAIVSVGGIIATMYLNIRSQNSMKKAQDAASRNQFASLLNEFIRENSIFMEKEANLKTSLECYNHAISYVDFMDRIAYLIKHGKISREIGDYFKIYYEYVLLMEQWFDATLSWDNRKTVRERWPNVYDWCISNQISPDPSKFSLPPIMAKIWLAFDEPEVRQKHLRYYVLRHKNSPLTTDEENEKKAIHSYLIKKDKEISETINQWAMEESTDRNTLKLMSEESAARYVTLMNGFIRDLTELRNREPSLNSFTSCKIYCQSYLAMFNQIAHFFLHSKMPEEMNDYFKQIAGYALLMRQWYDETISWEDTQPSSDLWPAFDIWCMEEKVSKNTNRFDLPPIMVEIWNKFDANEVRALHTVRNNLKLKMKKSPSLENDELSIFNSSREELGKKQLEIIKKIKTWVETNL